MVNEFLKKCQISTQDSYEAFKTLLNNLENEKNRKSAITLLYSLLDFSLNQNSPEEMTQIYHFSFSELKLKNNRLLLLRLPSTFAPEEWSFTFFEGLSRYKNSEFEDRTVVELGCGIGWISLALAMQTKPKKIYGLDINPRAIICARINLYLNSYDLEANPIWISGDQKLDDIIEFHVSDLFEYCRQKNLSIDRVIGCIPQVLNPDPEFMAKMLKADFSEETSDEFLHSLSNYAPQQGQIEDQFGLGLIAKAVEDSVDILKNSGKIILNLGGRPGKKVLQQLFLRRGFSIRQIWKTQVEQAKDTDIKSLVEIESKSDHRFEFYIENSGETPVSAHTALAYALAGGRIAHGLMVYEAKLRDPAHLPKIINTLRQKGFEQARDAIDLSYQDDSLTEEKSSFLSALSFELETSDFFPYQKTSGFESFRKNLVLYFKNYFRLYFLKENFVITPSRLVTCRNIVSIYKPKRILIDSQLASKNISDCSEMIEIPQGSDLLCELITKLKPDLVFYSMPEPEARNSDALLRIIEISLATHTRVFIDISDFFEFSSSPPSNGIFRYLESNKLPSHITLFCGLVKNRIYTDLQVCFVISENPQFVDFLINTAELTYSRTPFLSQFYYNCILNDLLSFQVIDSARYHTKVERKCEGIENSKFIQAAPSTLKAFQNPAISGERVAQNNKDLLRLDYGENVLPTAPEIKHILFESFAHQSIPSEDCNASEEIIQLNCDRWSLQKSADFKCILAGGVAPIFSEIANHCSHADDLMIFPSGSYGYFMASAEFHGASIKQVQTDLEHDFKLNIESLKALLLKNQSRCSWIILSAPIVNPTGAIYSTGELQEIVRIVNQNNAILVLDSIFSGLGFFENEEIVQKNILSSCRWLILGGVSKEFASGGLRIGYALTTDSGILEILNPCELTSPHRTLCYALKKILQRQKQMSASLEWQKNTLRERAKKLTQVLSESGWSILPPRGGLFLIATPEGLIGRKQKEVLLTFDNLAYQLRLHTGITINSPEWIGIPGYFRFVLSVSEKLFHNLLFQSPI